MKNLLLIALALVSFTVSAQKVKNKKGTWEVDGVAYLEQSCKNVLLPPCVFSSPVSGKKLFSITSYQYTRKARVHKGNNVWVTEDKIDYYYHIQFMDSDHEFYTRQHTKKMMKEMYSASILTDKGEVDTAKLEEFIKIFGEEKPVVVSSN